SKNIRQSYKDVQFTMLVTLGLVILVIFLFLRNASATLIPSMALPFSILGTFAMMYVLDYSLDNLSMMALILSIGFVVDDAIVMLENIVRHLEAGEAPLEAALTGSREIGFTILTMTTSLSAVFIPILFMGGIVGRLMHEFAVTIAASILVSGVVSLSLTPMLCSRFLKPLHSMHHGWMYNAVERMFDAWLKGYAWTLKQTIRFKGTTMLVSAAMLAGTVYLFMVIPKGFIPNVDTGQISGSVEMAQGLGYDLIVQHMQDLMRVLQQDPNIMAFTADAGGGRLNMDLKPRDQRTLTADQIIEELRPKLNRVAGVRVTLQNPPAIRIGGGPGRGAGGYQIALQDPDTEELYRIAPDFESRMRELPQLQDITSDLQLKTPQVTIDLDREQIAALGLTVDQVQAALSYAYSQGQISQIYAPDDEYQVILGVAPKYQTDPAALSMLYVMSATTSKLVPLSAVVTTRQSVGPQQINHIGQLPSVTITFNPRPGIALGDALAAVQDLARRTLPQTVQATPQGTAQAFQDSMRGLGWILALAIFVIYVVLGILYESFIHPLTILSGLPSAGFGALVTLLIFKADLDIYAFVGVIMLVGLVKKNGIMMVDFAVEKRRDHEISAADAIYEACLVRFRPIMMTTMAALMGTLPIALGWGAGAEARRPLGLAVVGGLLVSQTLTLYVTPVFYVYMEMIQDWLKGRRASKRAPVLTPVASAK
ncbi:MAG TPA: efflux RND transporter permease subunit, partial [Vicinamibacterales bacterium]|nr:efflux RND transporter permease subunit [Vicinamibacterales bacterium]